ncbi:Pimeloyl-ACP methyl ester carboxylesterase [Geodermatophilus saharensis]|uniref:Pimeloyl-ACP methyl ester carboxylesterase n=1 Tax=Geodermatophilus saharensis TaxID=1137994 RepID=A0A239G948_9ACTN|nr:alpha/beta hydrolase [Geodermatophilus saharensis]SNS65621.1 Pimeloyl-ACP methyl ester carboxylesterase [Geodermatophilus saharensis]
MIGSVAGPGPRLAYERWQGGSGPALVLVHGGAHNLRVWDRTISGLTGIGPVIAYDLRGHGGSEGDGDQSLATHAADLGRVVDHLALRRPVIVGHSFGASIALTYANTVGSCRALVLLDALVRGMAATYHTSAADVASSLDAHSRFTGDDASADAWIERSVAMEPPEQRPVWKAVARRSLLRHAGRAAERPSREEVLALIEAQFGWTPEEMWEELTVPALLLLARTGEPPPAGPDEELRHSAVRRLARRPGVRVTWIDSDHNLPACRSAEVVAAITGWLSTTPAR